MDLEEETWKFKLALGVGLLFLYAGRVLERQAVAGRWSSLLQFAPAVAALAVTTSGVLIMARAVMDLQRL